MSISAGVIAAPIRRDNSSGEIEVDEYMPRPFLKQDAILGHVASRGDRYPRTINKSPVARAVNGFRTAA
jgi:hypothetical protein